MGLAVSKGDMKVVSTYQDVAMLGTKAGRSGSEGFFKNHITLHGDLKTRRDVAFGAGTQYRNNFAIQSFDDLRENTLLISTWQRNRHNTDGAI